MGVTKGGFPRYLKNFGAESFCYYKGSALVPASALICPCLMNTGTFSLADKRCMCQPGYSGSQCEIKCPGDFAVCFNPNPNPNFNPSL